MSAHERKFGVEIECGFQGGTSGVRRLFGFEAYAYMNDDGWSIGADGSGVELRTPPLQGKKGFDAVRDAMERLKAHGAFVTRADGLHVHHDAPEFVNSPKKCLQLLKTWKNNERAIRQLVAPNRVHNSSCPGWGVGSILELEQIADHNLPQDGLVCDRNDLNLLALEEHGTIEIRLHEGTLDADAAIAWIKFGQKLLASVLERAQPIDNAPDDMTFLTRIKLSGQAKAVFAQKKLDGHYTPASAYRY